MLKEVYIENLAVIEKAVISFSKSFNVFTGETGAGKSILINGINAILGQRITKDIVRTGCAKAVITALFNGLSDGVKARLIGLGFDIDNDEISLTREINADGGSTARINYRTVPVSVMKEIGNMLINIHGQHDSQILLSPEKHLHILDNFGGDFTLLNDYRDSFKELQLVSRRTKELINAEKERVNHINELKRIIVEIKELELEEDEDIQVEDEYNLMKNSDKISSGLKNTMQILSAENEDNVIDNLMTVENELGELTDIKEISDIYDRITAVRIELADISSEVSDILSGIDFDEKRFEYIRNRRHEIYNAKIKFGRDVNEIIKLYNDSIEELGTFEGSTDELHKLKEDRERLLFEVTEKAKALSAYREKVAKRFVERVTKELEFLDMPNVTLDITHEKGKLTVNGMDLIEILISANKGESPKPISKIASGGELSRIMLALKSVIADKDDIPTLIFDEIDTGVSGRAAKKIGVKLHQISEMRQVICVTHLAQIAAMADNHLLIEKKVVNDRTLTVVQTLSFEERKAEIARIIGGENPSDIMLKNAEELLNYRMELKKG